MKKILLICFVSLVVESCDDPLKWLATNQYVFFRVQNNSALTIIVYGDYILPDTILPQEKRTSYVKILPEKMRQITDRDLSDKGLKRFETEKLSLFIIDDQIFQTTPWDTISKHNMILKRYEINRQDYNNLKKRYGDISALPYP